MSPACCGLRSVRIIQVSNARAGLTGLDELLKQVYLEGWRPDDENLAKRLVEGIRAAGNYVAEAAEAAYAQSLLNLYRAHVAAAQHSPSQGAPKPGEKR